MEYHGKLYGRLGPNQYFYTGKTSDDWDQMELKIKDLEEEVRQLKSKHGDNKENKEATKQG